MNWFLVFSFAVGGYLGPMDRYDCEKARMVFNTARCLQPIAYTLCSNTPGGKSGQICPDWTVETQVGSNRERQRDH